ncbi:MAG: zinc-ribbon domain-containing protein [Methanobrevibacter sp.]|uniref:Zinc-ribbon domain-containing protein n=1 Tax=Methanobrevibacter millerae TaxID=230361 RepID=A0A8T3VB47_9EURY|nr:zinc-ribbon domain-containing protein [Methanobrevibacter millerae]MBE6504362.1 zinc-ribbon domain-containing protein [Methanobrevibacter millerae]MBQ2637117.1 zinc-ribbon domain-containing protein [Methanobrevibacter sp.]MBR0058373.1 zinc-ribbon domain-containing protein [Methanobrevibacter sp.]MBR0370464.1 zinc-ribbon domain-containing protein [Methanobrevibacter sp.]
MIICPECGEENPQGSKFCRKCGVNLVYEEPEPEKTKTTAKKVTVEDNTGPIRRTTVNRNSSTTNTKKDDDSKLWACCICLVFLFIIFAIFGH